MKTKTLGLVALSLGLLLSPPLWAGFSGTDLVIVATARAQGKGTPPAQFYSTLWITNPSLATPAKVDVQLLRQGQANPTPLTKPITIAAGETRKYENVLQSLFETDGSGAIRILSNIPVLASSRTYDRPDGTDIKDSKGLFFAAIPSFFAAARGDTAHLQGVSEGGAEDYRYNFGFVEVAGKSAKIRTTLKAESGAPLGSKIYELSAFEARQFSVRDIVESVATTNGRIEATVIEGDGSVFLYGTAIANGSQDSVGFEMSFKDGLLTETANQTSEGLSALTAQTVPAIARACTTIAPFLGLAGSAHQPSLNDYDYTATYDQSTGFWTVSLTLPTGQTAQFQMQFQDASGTPSKLYNPLLTERIIANGSATGILGTVSFNLVMTGAKASSVNLTINGTGTGSYQGVSGTFEVINVIQPKVPGSYPISGTIRAVAGAITVTVSFNGTQYATGTYTYRNRSYTFTINLQTGEVIPS